MRPERYEFVGWENIESDIRSASDQAIDAFVDLIDELAAGPYPGEGPEGVLPYKDGAPNSFSAPFADGFLVYQVMRDQPVIKLLLIVLSE